MTELPSTVTVDHNNLNLNLEDIKKLWESSHPIEDKGEIVEANQTTDVITFKKKSRQETPPPRDQGIIYGFEVDDSELIMASNFLHGEHLSYQVHNYDPWGIQEHRMEAGEQYKLDDSDGHANKTLTSRSYRIDGYNMDRGEGLPYRFDDADEDETS